MTLIKSHSAIAIDPLKAYIIKKEMVAHSDIKWRFVPFIQRSRTLYGLMVIINIVKITQAKIDC